MNKILIGIMILLLLGGGYGAYDYFTKEKAFKSKITQTQPVQANKEVTSIPIVEPISPLARDIPVPEVTETPKVEQSVSVVQPKLEPRKIGPWLIVITNPGTPLGKDAADAICDKAVNMTKSWLNSELAKNNIKKTYSDIYCFPEQVILGDLQYKNGGDMTGEGVTFPNPINDTETIKFLETKPEIANASYVTIFNYLYPTNLKYVNYAISTKYDFEFITSFVVEGQKYYSFNIETEQDFGSIAKTLTHEFLHKIGANDKYAITPDNACLNDPATGKEYLGNDIMCARVPSMYGGGGYAQPDFPKIFMSEPTVTEVKKYLTEQLYEN